MTQTNLKDIALSNPATPDDLFQVLQSLGIAYKYYEHPEVSTVEEYEKLGLDLEGLDCRNLFVRDKKERQFLVVVPDKTKVDIKKLQDVLECDRLSFGSADRLQRVLGVQPGSVCPYALINDRNDHSVTVILDEDMMQAEWVNYHPLINTMTISVTPEDLLKFLDWTGHEVRQIKLAEI